MFLCRTWQLCQIHCSTAGREQLGDHMVVFGQGDLRSLGISPSDIHRGAGNLFLSIAIIKTDPWATVVLSFCCICFFVVVVA